MSRATELLKQATPPSEWSVWRYQNGGGRVSIGNRLLADFYEEGERELFLHARSRLPDYEAAVEVLTWIAELHEPRGKYCNVCGGNWPCLTNEKARAALARLREGEAANVR